MALNLYALTLQKSSAITAACYGNFSAPRQQELIIARGGRVLELARPDENGKVQTVHATDVFGIIRALATCRLTGGNRDYIVVGSDSGKIVILEYSAEKQCFDITPLATGAEWLRLSQKPFQREVNRALLRRDRTQPHRWISAQRA